MGFEGKRAHANTTMRDGDERFVALSWSDHEPPQSYQDAADRMWRTQEYWREWLNHGEFPDHPWRIHLQRSALTLKGLTYAPTGALMAAATTSLPETPGGERNWDYRYSWIRDSTFALWGLYTLGFDSEADGFFEFVADRCQDGSDLQVMYGLGGERDLTESILPHLSGYEDAQPVRIGNGAYDQDQHDVWGVLLDSDLPEREVPRPPARTRVADRRRAGREGDRALARARPGHLGGPRRAEALHLVEDVLLGRARPRARASRAVAARRRSRRSGAPWPTRSTRTSARTASTSAACSRSTTGRTRSTRRCCCMPLVRFLPKDDERVRATVLAIADELTMDGLVLRYRVEQTDDGLSGEEGTFTICSFWLVSALVEIGELRRARALCEKLLSFASPLQLYAEEIDAVTGRHLGNFPQAFTHLALDQRGRAPDPGRAPAAARLLDGPPDRHLMRALVAAPGAPGGIELREVDEPDPGRRRRRRRGPRLAR